MSATTTSRFRPLVKRANGAVYSAGVILGFLTWFAISATTWLFLFALDNLLALPPIVRLPLALAALVVMGGCFWKYVVGAMADRRSNDEIALMLEERFGIEENVLINTVQFEDMQYGERQKDFVAATADAASNSWKRVPFRQLWQAGRMSALWCLVALVLAVWIGYIVLAPSHASSAFARYTHRLTDEPAIAEMPTLTITPADDLTIAEHANLEVTLDVSSLAGNKELTIAPVIFHKEGRSQVAFQRGDGKDERMDPVVGNENLYTYTFKSVRRSFAFRVFVGDMYSRGIQVTVNPMPRIVESGFTVTPPAYVCREPREQAGPPNPVECLPNSKLAVDVKLDRPVDWLRWQWADGEIEFQKMDEFTWNASVDVGKAAGSYDLMTKTASLEKPSNLATGTIMLKSDRNPSVEFVDMDMSHVVSPGARLTLHIRANDDHGLGELEVTRRRALSGSSRHKIRQWSFGEAPGQRGRVEKRTELTIDASEFVPGNKYFIEARAKDYCPTNEWVTSEPLLITVKGLEDRLKASKGSSLEALYAALEEAIHAQKRALDATRNLMTNIDDVWLDFNRNPRTDEAIQNILDKSRERILTEQVRVRTALIRGVDATEDKADRMALKMYSISQDECPQANDQAFAAGRRRLRAGELKPANGRTSGASFPEAEQVQTVVFNGKPARYFALVVSSVHGWERDSVRLRNLQLLDEEGKPCPSADWKPVAPADVQNAQNALTQHSIEIGVLPRYFVFDMGSEREVTGISCEGSHEVSPKDFALYLTTDAAPKVAALAPDKEYTLGELKLLELIQAAIYNQLIALKGGEFDRLAAKKEELVRIALGEEGEEPDASVGDKLDDLKDQLKEWLGDYEENMKERKLVMATPSDDLTDEDLQKLTELNVEKRKLARSLEKMIDDLARTPWDYADETQVKIVEETLHKLGEFNQMVDDAVNRPKHDLDASWNLDTQALKAGKELDTGQAPPRTGSAVQPGDSEDPEDMAASSALGALPSELPIRIMDLAKSLADLPKFDAESGSQQMDHSNPKGGQTADNLDSASAAGQMTDHTPNPKKTIKGRGNLGRAGRADGQMVAEKAPAVPNNEVKMPPRMSNSASEKGGVNDQDNVPATAIGLGKGTGSPSEFARSGRLPPDALRRLREFAGQTKETRENARALLLMLDRHNLPTTDLKRALHRLEQINNGREGIDVRQALSEAEGHLRAAQGAVASAIELRQQEAGREREAQALDSARGSDDIPDGLEQLISEYFKVIADRSADRE